MLCKQLGPGLNCSVVGAVRTGALISMTMSARLVTVLGRVRVLVPSSILPKVKNASESCKEEGSVSSSFLLPMGAMALLLWYADEVWKAAVHNRL
jgi:hypothetical protein